MVTISIQFVNIEFRKASLKVIPVMPDIKNDRPLVTFAMIAYNQEAFIREAISGAFAQTYSPLQVILSDDCSSDRTYEIMQEEAKKYKGEHDILVNRNARNLGIGAHINKIMSLAKGVYIVAAGGDDISVPGRTECLISHFLESENCYSVYSNFFVIDEHGHPRQSWLGTTYIHPNRSLLEICRQGVFVYGCTHAWKKELFEVFGDIDNAVIREDHAIPFRSALLGDIGYIDEKLVYYRRHGQNINTPGNEMHDMAALLANRKAHAQGEAALRNTMANDFSLYLNLRNLDRGEYLQEVAILGKQLLASQINRDLLGCIGLKCKFFLFARALRYRVGIYNVLKFFSYEFFPIFILIKRRLLNN